MLQRIPPGLAILLVKKSFKKKKDAADVLPLVSWECAGVRYRCLVYQLLLSDQEVQEGYRCYPEDNRLYFFFTLLRRNHSGCRAEKRHKTSTHPGYNLLDLISLGWRFKTITCRTKHKNDVLIRLYLTVSLAISSFIFFPFPLHFNRHFFSFSRAFLLTFNFFLIQTFPIPHLSLLFLSRYRPFMAVVRVYIYIYNSFYRTYKYDTDPRGKYKK